MCHFTFIVIKLSLTLDLNIFQQDDLSGLEKKKKKTNNINLQM